MNVPLLRKVQAYILTNPEHFNQSRWCDEAACGTVACIAGWALILRSREPLPRRGLSPIEALRRITRITIPPSIRSISDLPEQISDRIYPRIHGDATRALKLEPHIAQRVFHIDMWPEPFQTLHKAAPSPSTRACVAAARIEYLIQNGA